MGIATAGVFKTSAVLSLAGTTLEYGAYHYADLDKNSYGDSRYTFAADATLDVGKAVVSGGAGAALGFGASILATTGAGAVWGSVVPGVGNAVGAVVGLITGVVVAVNFESKVYGAYGTRKTFSEYLERKFK